MRHTKIGLIVLAFSLQLASVEVFGQNVQEKFYEQKLDHSGSNPGTWKQRYLENLDYYKPGGPIFVIFGGPIYGPVNPDVLTKGATAIKAKKQGAAVVLLEIRFFGKSRPTSDISTENLHKYATIENTLADGETFIQWYKSQSQFQNPKVVGFGHTYLGSRVLQHMRTKPGLIDIGVVSSAIVEAAFEFPELFKSSLDVLREFNEECATTVHDAMLCSDKIIHGESCEGHNIKDLKETFNLCADVDPNNRLDSAALIGEILKQISIWVYFDNPKSEFNLHKICDAMGDKSKGLSHMDKLAEQMKKGLQFSGQKCLEFRFSELEKKLEVDDWENYLSGGPDDRAFTFFRCKYSMTLRTPEGVDLPQDRIDSFRAYNLEMCKKAFNISPEKVKEGSEMTNMKYGQRMIPNKCVIFITEENDIGKKFEITTQEEAGKCNAVVISKGEGGVFSDDLIDGDSNNLNEAQREVSNLLDKWLKTGNCCPAAAKRLNWSARQVFSII